MKINKFVDYLPIPKSNVTITTVGDTTKESKHIYIISLILIITLALVIRIYISFNSGLPWFSSDTYTYISMADAILAGHPFSQYPNGLPILIAIVKFVFNPEKTPFILVSLNVILSTLIVFLTANMTNQVSGKKMLGIIAGAILVLYPNQLNYVRQILSEVPTCFLLTLSIFLFLRKKYFLSGLTLFFTILFRTDLLLVLPLIFICSLFHFSRLGQTKKVLYYFGGYGLGFVMYTMLLNFGVVSSTNRYGLEILKSIISDSLQEEYRSITNFSIEEKQHPIHTYMKFMFDHPKEYIKQRLSALENMWGWPPAQFRSFGAKMLIAVRFPIFILAIVGFWKYRKDFDAWVLLIPVVALTILHIATYSAPRYTFTVEPLLISLASLSFSKKLNTNSLTQSSKDIQ